MRILHISTRLILGGSQENTVLSCEGQARRGHDVHLAFGPIYGPEGSLLERVRSFNCDHPEFSWASPEHGPLIKEHVVPHLCREVAPASDLRALGQLKALIRRTDPDIVHTHSSKAGILGRAAAWAIGKERARQGRPLGVVHTIHGPPFMPVEGSPLSRAKVRLNNWIYTRAERHAAKRCHVIVSVADAMTRQFLARGIGKPDQYVTVRSGMELGPYLEPEPGETRDEVRHFLGLRDDDFVIGTVARLAQHKGHDDLLDALATVLPKDRRVRLLWVGDGWWRDRLLARVRGLGIAVTERVGHPGPDSATTLTTGDPAGRTPAEAFLAPQLLLTGLVPPGRVPPLIRAMDVLCHPSSREGLPRTVPQALLCGVMPVAYDCDGTGEICRDNQTGRLVPTGDVRALRDALLWSMEHPAERAALAARGRDEAIRGFSADKMVDDLDAVYARALTLARG